MNHSNKSTREFRTWVTILSVLPLCANQLVPVISLGTSALIMWFVYAAIAWVLGSRIVGLALLGSVLAPFLLVAPAHPRNLEHFLLQSLLMMAAGAVGGALLGWTLDPEEVPNQDVVRDEVEAAQEDRTLVAI